MKTIHIITLLISIANLQPIHSELSVNEKHLININNYLNESIDPCDNFYEYACGSWRRHHTNDNYAEATGLVDHKLNKKLIQFLENTQSNLTDYGVIHSKVIQYYQSCRSKQTLGFGKYLQLIKPAAGLQWPILHNSTTWPGQKFNWFLTLAKLRRYGMNNVLIQHSVLQSMDDASVYSIYFDKPDAEASKLPRSSVVFILMQLGLNKTQAFNMSHQLKNLEKEIIALQDLDDEYGSITMYIDELEEQASMLAWRQYFEIILSQKITSNLNIQFLSWTYLNQLVVLLQKTEPELLCNYVMVHFVNYLWKNGVNTGTKMECLSEVRSKMELALNFLYMKHILKNKVASYNLEVQNMFKELKHNFLEKLSNNMHNFSDQRLDFLKLKLQKLELNMGNVQPNLTSKEVESYYESVNLHAKSYVHNHLNLLKLHFKQEHSRLTRPQAPTPYVFLSDEDTAISSTPYYLVRQNDIVVPYGILQTPMYHSNMHDVIKWSLFGFLLAHELAHGFDSTGIFYTANGNFHETFAHDLNYGFESAISCIKDNDSNAPTEHVDERIADIVGIRLAHDVLFARKNHKSMRMKFTKLSAKRLFFLNFAQFFCGSLDSEFFDHDSDNVRLMQTLKNFKPFAEEFECKLGSNMNPRKKCRLW